MSEINKEVIKEIIHECMQELVGDTPVPYQLDVALGYKADIDEQHALREDVDMLKKEVQRLAELVGDTSVAEQVNAAFNR